MPCTECDRQINKYNNYYNSNGIINCFLCKICNRCAFCHINDSDHKIVLDTENYDTERVEVEIKNTKVPDVFENDWR